MAPYELRDMTKSELSATLHAMMSAEWVIALEESTPTEKKRAAMTLLALNHARTKMNNAELANIRDKLIENEAELIQGKKELDKALKKLNQVKKVLDAATAFMKVVGRIVKLIAKLT
jgi:hypothetical protein